MKLSQVLTHTNQVERSKFVNCIDRLCQSHKDDTNLLRQLDKIDGQLKAASGNEITQLFGLIKGYYKQYVKEQIAIGGPQVSLLVNILSRDGNCIASISWIENLYAKEYNLINTLSQQLLSEINENEEYDYNRIHRLEIYKQCISTAFNNDEKYNREAKISDDERRDRKSVV